MTHAKKMYPKNIKNTMTPYFRKLQRLTESELVVLENLTTSRKLRKGDFLIQEGEICSEIVLIKSGILRSFYINNNGDEITYCIAFENQLMSAYSSFITQNGTEENIQAICDTDLIVLQKRNLELLYYQSVNWQKVSRLLTELQYIELEKRIVSFQKQTAKQRYQKLIEEHSNYIKFIPLQYLASYLGISPRHLSRLRKNS